VEVCQLTKDTLTLRGRSQERLKFEVRTVQPHAQYQPLTLSQSIRGYSRGLMSCGSGLGSRRRALAASSAGLRGPVLPMLSSSAAQRPHPRAHA